MTELQLRDTMPENRPEQRIRDMTNTELSDEYEAVIEDMERVVEEIRFRKMNQSHPANRHGSLPPIEEEGAFNSDFTEYYLTLGLL